jgi:hypothetical protein
MPVGAGRFYARQPGPHRGARIRDCASIWRPNAAQNRSRSVGFRVTQKLIPSLHALIGEAAPVGTLAIIHLRCPLPPAGQLAFGVRAYVTATGASTDVAAFADNVSATTQLRSASRIERVLIGSIAYRDVGERPIPAGIAANRAAMHDAYAVRCSHRSGPRAA